MPKFDFKCSSCGCIELDVIVPTYTNEKLCENCQSAMNKIYNYDVNFVLKGSGWAKDGYSKGGNNV